MNIASVDLNLLVAFDAIVKERNVTSAAVRLGVSQPAMSNALARLRMIFNDPLFVRTSQGMQPTPYAEQLIEPISRACELITSALQINSEFDPATTTKTFSFYMTEIGEILLLPKLLKHIQTAAPNACVRVRRIPEQGAKEAMANGEIDLAVGLFPYLKAGFYQQRLYTDKFACIARKDHPTVKDSLSPQQYVDTPHVIVLSTNTGHDAAIEKILLTEHLRRKIVMTSQNFLVLPMIIEQTDAIATIPYRMAQKIASYSTDVKILESPIAFPNVDIKQHWHERFHYDPANKWIRDVMVTLFRE
jgi:DNA-binding transcriptional LysR family regulator